MSIMMEYLRQLQKNNQRDWFQSHKELRKEAEAEFEELLQELMERIACFDSSIIFLPRGSFPYRLDIMFI